jgi:predicted HAD superfamily Cof-like phosphohydrolase
MKKLLDDVTDFHMATGVPVCPTPKVPSPERVKLRATLISEEHKEVQEALLGNDLAAIAKELADSIYVHVGTALEYGIPLDRVWDEVQRSNMAKVDPVTGLVKRREDGKILKPDGWQPPDIEGVLFGKKGIEHV